jgi:hypothetical protein
MSDAAPTSAGAATGGSAQFTERELQMLGWAMQSLKTGPPEVHSHPHTHPLPHTHTLANAASQIDYEKLAAFAGMGNPRSASNAWAKIKNKLGGEGAAPATPKKAASGRKKAVVAEGEDGEASPKKTPRKRAAKKQDVEGEESPKKKGRAAKKSSAVVEEGE